MTVFRKRGISEVLVIPLLYLIEDAIIKLVLVPRMNSVDNIYFLCEVFFEIEGVVLNEQKE